MKRIFITWLECDYYTKYKQNRWVGKAATFSTKEAAAFLQRAVAAPERFRKVRVFDANGTLHRLKQGR